MQKIQAKTNNKIIPLNPFLQNDYLKKRKIKLKKRLFKNNIFLNQKDNILIEYNPNQTIFLPKENQEKDFLLYLIQTQYESNLLLDFQLNDYFFLRYLTEYILKLKRKKKVFRARFITGNRKKVFLSFLGFIFSIKLKNLNERKRLLYSKKLKFRRFLQSYKLKSLRFERDVFSKNQYELSRNSYVKEVRDRRRRSLLSRIRKKNATI